MDELTLRRYFLMAMTVGLSRVSVSYPILRRVPFVAVFFCKEGARWNRAGTVPAEAQQGTGRTVTSNLSRGRLVRGKLFRLAMWQLPSSPRGV